MPTLGFDDLVTDSKTHNHWKMFIQVFIMASGPFMHDNILTFLGSYFPSFEAFRNNKGDKMWVKIANFFIDFALTIPILFFLFTCYSKGLYIMLPISFFMVYLLPLFNKSINIVEFGTNPRRTILTLAPRKFRFVFVDYQISTIFLLITFAILFCDTSLFDNVLSKTSRRGIGTMDLGAGLILFTSGTTSRQARGNLLPYYR